MKLLQRGYIADLRQYSKRGIPNCLRSQMWKRILDVKYSEEMNNYFNMLQSQVFQWDFLVDELFYLDVQNCINHDTFFPFDDKLEAIIMAFSRDPWILRHSQLPAHAPLITEAKK